MALWLSKEMQINGKWDIQQQNDENREDKIFQPEFTIAIFALMRFLFI